LNLLKIPNFFIVTQNKFCQILNCQ